MSQLGDNLKNATAYEVAKVATGRNIVLADDDIDALAALITSVVLEELASRELHGREVASRDETTNTWAEHSVRIDEYAEAARDLRFDASGVSQSEPATPTPRQEWAVSHPSVTLTPHRSPHSVLYTLSKLPGGEIVTRCDAGDPWARETTCLCGEHKPEVRHFFGCPEGVTEWATANGWCWRTVTGDPGVLWTPHRGDALPLRDVRLLYGDLSEVVSEGTDQPEPTT